MRFILFSTQQVARSWLLFALATVLGACGTAAGNTSAGDLARDGADGAPGAQSDSGVGGTGNGTSGVGDAGSGADATEREVPGGMVDSGLSTSTSGPMSNGLFRISATKVSFHSGSYPDAVLQIEALKTDVAVTARALWPSEVPAPETIVDEVRVRKTGTSSGEVVIEPRSPVLLPAGVFQGKVRVRGCLEDVCEDIIVDVEYTNVHLWVDGKPSILDRTTDVYRAEHMAFDRTVLDAMPGRRVIPLSLSNGGDAAWRAELRYLDRDDAPKNWLVLETASAASLSVPLVISFNAAPDAPMHLLAEVVVTSGAAATRFNVGYENRAPLEVSATEVKYTAKVGQLPEVQKVQIFDRRGDNYKWQPMVETEGDCPKSFGDCLGVERADTGINNFLPGELSFHAPIANAPCRCTATVTINAFYMRHQTVKVTLEVTE